MKSKILTMVLALLNTSVWADSITFTEKLTDKLVCETFEGETFCDVGTTIGATINATLTSPDVRDIIFDADSVELTLGGLQFSFADAEPGATANRVVFVERVFDDNDRSFELGRLTLSRSGNVLTIAGNHKDLEASIVSEQFRDEPGPFVDNLDGVEFAFSAGPVSVQRTLYFKGSTTRTRRVVGSGEDFFLSSVQAMGAADFTPPTITITSPKPNQRWSNEVFTVRCKATDNVAVQDVFIDINGDGYSPAPLSDDGSEWTLVVPLVPGTNTVRAYAIDRDDNHSKTNSQKVVFVVVSPVILNVGLGGKVTGVTNQQKLEVGKNYKVTAAASNNFFFVNWVVTSDISGPTENTNAMLTFRMETNMVLRANFITNQFLAIKGVYNGLFAPAGADGGSAVDPTNSGFAALTLTDKGKFTGKLLLAGAMHSFSGAANVVDGTAHVLIKPTAQPALTLDLEFDVNNGADTTGVTGRVSRASWESPLSAYRAAAPAQGAVFAGKHTFLIPGADADLSATCPAGDGAGTVMVVPSGVLTLAGAVGDGTAISQSVPLSKGGDWPLYVSLYGGKGVLWGWVSFSTNTEPYRFQGDLAWIKRAGAPADKFYSNGFEKTNEIFGAKYTPPKPGTNTLSWPSTNGVLLIDGGNVEPAISNAVTLVKNKVTVLANSNKVSVTFTPATGLFSGSFLHPANGKTATVKGALLQLPAPFYGLGSGWFRGTNQSGYFRIEAATP